MSKEARVHLDTNSYSVPHTLVGRTVHLRADDETVRIVDGGTVVATHKRSWDRRRAVEDDKHIDAMLERRPSARGPRRRDRLAALSHEAALYLHEVGRRKINLENEVRKLLRFVDQYGEREVGQAMAKALVAKTFGARYVRALLDQARFASGLGEAPEPIVTGNAAADSAEVTPHDLEGYDDLF